MRRIAPRKRTVDVSSVGNNYARIKSELQGNYARIKSEPQGNNPRAICSPSGEIVTHTAYMGVAVGRVGSNNKLFF